MLRTIVLRNQILNDSLKKAIRTNIARCVSSELTRRKLSTKVLAPQNKVLTPGWTIQTRLYSSLPSHSKVNLPALSPTMDAGAIVSWEKKEGDKLSEATMGFETPEEGYLAKILIPAGTKNVPVAAAAAPAAAAPAAPAAAAPAPSAPAPSAPAAAAPAHDPGSRIYASPMARRLAELNSLRLAGSAAAAKAAPAARDAPAAPPMPAPGATFVDIPLSGMRATIAKRLSAAKQTIPHYQLSVTVNLDKTLAMRKAVNEKAEFSNVDVSVAVATPTGLITPILFNADSRGVLDLSRNMKELAEKAKNGKLTPQEYQGGTVTISNLGMY
ncbi:Acetyltransferase component of pyruvate dehydrogenase complex, partial [Operophtera brumata]